MPPFVPPSNPPAQIQPPSPPATPPLIEVYYSDPKTLPNHQPTPAAESSAASLGDSISIGTEARGSAFQDSNLSPQPSNSPQKIEKIVLQGLESVNLGEKAVSSQVLLTQQRSGNTREFDLTPPPPDSPPAPEEPARVIELIADRQEYDSQQQVIIATGKVEMRFANAVLLADRLRVNLPNRIAVAEGEVVLKRGEQILRGERFEYYFVQDRGVIFNASGEIYQASTRENFSPSLPTDLGGNLVPNLTLSDRLAVNQPLQRVTTAEGYRFVVGTSLQDLEQIGRSGSGEKSGGQVNRLRFQAERVDFKADEWKATKVRVTNDPFSPPELEVQAEEATYRNIEPLVDELTMTNSQVVLDQRVSVPTFQDRLIFDRRNRQPAAFSFGYDKRDRGGLFVQRGFDVIDTQAVSFELVPQYLIQKALFNSPPTGDDGNQQDEEGNDTSCGGALSPCAFGLLANFNANLSPRTNFFALNSLSSLDLGQIENSLRSKVALQQKVGDIDNPHELRFEYNYRERLFNGSLGFQTVNNSIGAIFVSPTITLGNTGIQLSYQGSIQSINAPTDQSELLGPNPPENNLVTLARYQAAASLRRNFRLWQGESLPPTPEAGLHYTAKPLLPFLELTTSITGVTSLYGNGDSQPSLSGSIGILGQLGHFSRPFFDYTGFTLTYSTATVGTLSPFLFDRFVDTQTLAWGITQQLYGPLRVGVQSSFNLESGDEISTDYYLEYSRRTYNILIRYNPVLQLGSINLRISDFNWSGNPGPFDGTLIRPVIDGVVR